MLVFEYAWCQCRAAVRNEPVFQGSFAVGLALLGASALSMLVWIFECLVSAERRPTLRLKTAQVILCVRSTVLLALLDR